MTKITLSNLASLTNETTALTTINSNFDAIEAAIDDLLSRDGTSPNTMEANLDMNSYRIQNLPEAVSDTEPVRKGDVSALVAGDIAPSRWYSGSGAPSNSAYEVGDFYLDTATQNVYEKTGSSAWVISTNIKGATGATGATGPAGAGTGDMLKSTYDSLNNGTVNSARAVPWSGISSKPTTLSGYGITDAQPLATKLTNFEALTWAANRFPYFTGTSTVVAGQLTAAGLALLDDADAAAQRSTLGLGTMATRANVSTGDIAAGAVTLAKLDTTGAANLVLTAQGVGSAPVWASPASSASGHVLLATVTPTAATTAVASGLTLSTYKKLLIEWTGVKNGTTSTTFRINSVVATAAISATTNTFSGFLEINLRTGFGDGISAVTTTAPSITNLFLNLSITSATTSITFSPSSGSFQAGGTIYIYGVL